MNIKNFFLILFLLSVTCLPAFGQANDTDNTLSPADKEWLREHNTWRLGVDPAWPPVEMVDKNGRYVGMGADYIAILEKRLGIKAQHLPSLSWSQVLEKVKNGEADILPLAGRTSDREKYLNFTKPILALPAVIITRSDRNDIHSLRDLDIRTVSVAKFYAIHEWLVENYPRVILRLYDDVEQSLQAVAFGEVDAYIGDLASATYFINSLGLTNLKVAGHTPYSYSLCMGVRKDWPELVPILDKAISAVSAKERIAIRDKWIVLKRQPTLKEVASVALPAIILVIVLTLLVFNWRLRIEVEERRRAQEALKAAQTGLEERIQRRTADLVQANEELRKGEEKYRDLVEGANSIIMRMDVKGNITFFNEFAQEFFGYKESEILGHNVVGTIVPMADTSGHNLESMIEDIMNRPERYKNNENENMTRSGKRVWIAWTNKAIFDGNNRAKEILCIGNDIGKLKQAEVEILNAKEVAETANKTKSAFLANMSHELRTPLNAIIGFSELMGEDAVGALNEKQKEYIGYVSQSGKHLLSLINDILDLSKVEAGKMELELSEFNLKELLKNSFVFVKEKAYNHNIRLSDDIKDDTGNIRADERKVRQAVFNLLSNAVKFTPDNGQIGIEAKKINDKEVQVCVWDTGIGVEKKDASKIFAEFEQIDSEYSRKSAGTGLGMPLSKKFVELHGGKMWFESEGKGRGSRFYFTLPMTQPDKK